MRKKIFESYFMLLLVLLFGCTQQASADRYLQDAKNFRVYPLGIDKVRLVLPTQNDLIRNEGISFGRVTISIDGGDRQALLDWNCVEYDELDKNKRIRAYQGGTFQLGGKATAHKTFNNTSGWIEYQLNPDDDDSDHYTTTVDWTIPFSLRGHKVKFFVYAYSEEDLSHWVIKDAELFEWTISEALEVGIVINEPMLAFDRSQIGNLMINYAITAKSVKSATFHYTDSLTKQSYSKGLSTKLSDYVYIPANRPWKDMYVEANIVDAEGNSRDGVRSNSIHTDMLHEPSDLVASLTEEGKAVLTWQVKDHTLADFSGTDNFEIQRNVSGNSQSGDANWNTIGIISGFVPGKKDYEYTDATLMDSYKGELVSYRVRRSSTISWQWADNSGCTMTTARGYLGLPSIQSAKVQRSVWNDEQHTLQFNYDTFTCFDANGRFIIRNSADLDTYKEKYYPNGVQGIFTITSIEDLKLFGDNLGDFGGRLNAYLLNDIIYEGDFKGIQNTFRGIFFGNGHRLELKVGEALFKRVDGAYICDLTIGGTQKSSSLFNGNLVSEVARLGSVTIERCTITSDITWDNEGDLSSGAFIGIVQADATATLNDCVFKGTINSTKSINNGGFIGVTLANTTISFTNCLFDPQEIQGSMQGCCTFLRYDPTSKLTFTNTYYTSNFKDDGSPVQGESAIGMSDEDLLAKLGNNWIADNNGVRPNVSSEDRFLDSKPYWDNRAKLELLVHMKGLNNETTVVDLSSNEEAIKNHQFTYSLNRKCVDYTFDLRIRRDGSPLYIIGTYADTLEVPVDKQEGAADTYQFLTPEKITKVTATTKQSSVRLDWETTGGESDYYRVLRRTHSSVETDEWTDTIATNLVTKFYEDKSVLVQQNYDYLVQSVLQCEGLKIYGNQCTGACEPTGRVSGYLRMLDGTAVGGITVTCTPDSIVQGAQSVYTTTTDDTGFFEFTGLPYQKSGKYYIHIKDGGFEGPNADGSVTFDANSNWAQDFNFYMKKYYVYSGNVYYRDTSIPVPGVSFMLDGSVMHDASNQVIVTDNQGAFELSIPSGEHRVQAVKNGHYFANKGFLINKDATNDSTLYYFNKNVAGVALWDSTTVLLRGRVVGGDVQGSMPLGSSLSKNNLGDSLKIVMQLEGDNTSWLIRKQNDESVKESFAIETFGKDGLDTTRVHTTRHSITISPDPKTGEYQLPLRPAKYKIIEVSAQGYPTLFQQGKVGETIDLAFNVNGDTCEYNRIYHTVPTVDVKQYNGKDEPYYGVRKMTATDNIGTTAEMNLWYYKKISDKDSVPTYAFGYPVFMAQSACGWYLQACEKYFKNNDTNSIPDIVKLNGGKVTIKNGLVSETDNTEITLDAEGAGSYVFTPQNATFLLANDMALKSVSITLEYNQSYYDIKPLDGKTMKGYVMATMPKPDGNKSVVAGTPRLMDILRDPPGSGSSAYMEAGSKLNYAYNSQMAGSVGIKAGLTLGENSTAYTGAVTVPPSGVGTYTGTSFIQSSATNFNIDAQVHFGSSWNYNYTMTTTERIQTSAEKKWIGGKADLFMGLTDEVVIEDAFAVRVIPQRMFDIYKNNQGGSFHVSDEQGNEINVSVPSGTMKLLATGVDKDNQPIYLVRDEVMSVGPRLKSTFVHSQSYIENELIPDLMKVRNSLLLPKGTSAAYAQSLADQKGSTVYVSQLPEDSVLYGWQGHYDKYYPAKGSQGDSILALNQEMLTWLGFLAKNEQEKLNVLEQDLVKRYSFDGASGISYSESFDVGESNGGYVLYPGIDIVESAANDALTILVETAKAAMNDAGQSVNNDPKGSSDNNKTQQQEVEAAGTKVNFSITPVYSLNANQNNTLSKSKSKTIGFSLVAGVCSSYIVDVYRTATIFTADTTDNGFFQYTTEILDELRNGVLNGNPDSKVNMSDMPVYSSLVFRTRGGVTSKPYEGERRSKFYHPGSVLDEATVPIDKIRMWVDEPVKSNVPFDEPARFKIHFANESEYPNRAATSAFLFMIDGASNPNGAKIYLDGMPVTVEGTGIYLAPCRNPLNNDVLVYTRELEIYPGTEFDYNDLKLTLMDGDDVARPVDVILSVHFKPAAGKVKISVPSDHWVINTESPYDGKRKMWYMPVRIEDFDVNYRGFDHIELQYKLSTQGDNDWVNVCSYYHDRSLMEGVSGVTDTIPSNGVIIAPFYGETDPIEQYYDLRAVSYCRHAGGFLTSSSQVISGIKDTRRPQSFGTPQPTNGILGIGDDIKIPFSENIAGNYLSKINNFEVLGTPNSTDITTSTALSFDGNISLAVSQSEKNIRSRSFTVDIMVNPATDAVDMPIFSHAGLKKGLYFGITADRHLMANINGQRAVSDSVVRFNGGFRQVAFALDQSGNDMTVTFFDESNNIGTAKFEGKYDNNAYLKLGMSQRDEYDYTNETVDDLLSQMKFYKGDMLEFRLWNRAMNSTELSSYLRKALTGYESGLVNYYRLNEGKGEFSYDKAVGANDLRLSMATWKRPSGISVKIDGDHGLPLKGAKLTRTNTQDYTLMFWFRNSGSDATFFSNGQALRGAKGELNIGVKSGQLYVRSDGFECQTKVYATDASWHHFAMTVSRSRNIANIYLDEKLYETCAADSFAGIVREDMLLGATYVDKNTQTNVMKGNIDEFGMFSSVLPMNLITEYATHVPANTTRAMMAYLNFGESVKQDDNTQRLEPTGLSLKQEVDVQGVIAPRRDYLATDSAVAAMADRTVYAPMTSTTLLANLKYSYVAKDNELLIDIEEPDYTIEKTNVFVTVKEVPDLQGNLMESPLTLNYYVYRNPLRWNVKRIEKEFDYGEGITFEATISNLSKDREYFELRDLPFWLDASITSGTIEALDEQVITFTVSPYMNVGNYKEAISLISASDMSDPLPISVKVKGSVPEWAVSPDLLKKSNTMMLVARIRINDVVANDPNDILGVFSENLDTMGVAHIEVDNTNNAGEALAYVTVFGSSDTKTLNFMYYDASTDNIYRLNTDDEHTIFFRTDSTAGSAKEPVELRNSWQNQLQRLHLQDGWNWVTIHLEVPDTVTVSQFLDGMSRWKAGDSFSTHNGQRTIQWNARYVEGSPRGYVWSNANKPITINPAQRYRIYSYGEKTAIFEGAFIYPNVVVKKGWNRIGFLSPINLPIAQALSGYTDDATEGDVIKSLDGFAVATQTQTGIVWKGSLQYMETGKGYMLKRLKDGEKSFYYPTYYSDSRYSGGNSSAQARQHVNASTTMNIVASVAGVALQQDDQLVVYRGAERLSEAQADADHHFYLNIGSDADSRQTFTFVLEREGQTVAVADSYISYQADALLGTPAEPTCISFADLEQMPADGKWYTTAGIQLSKKPTRPGFYIHNGEVKIIQ